MTFCRVSGDDKYILADDVIIQHPEGMKSRFNPYAEEYFYNLYNDYVMKYIWPIDPRIRKFINDLGTKDFSDPFWQNDTLHQFLVDRKYVEEVK